MATLNNTIYFKSNLGEIVKGFTNAKNSAKQYYRAINTTRDSLKQFYTQQEKTIEVWKKGIMVGKISNQQLINRNKLAAKTIAMDKKIAAEKLRNINIINRELETSKRRRVQLVKERISQTKLATKLNSTAYRVKALEQTYLKYYMLKRKHITLTKQEIATMNAAAASYTRMGGSVRRLTAAQGGLLKSFTKARWMLVNITMGAMLLAGAFRAIIKPQIELETAMAGVQKTTGFTNDKIKELRHQFVSLSKDIPLAAKELAEIGVVGGQLGLGKEGADSMLSFVRASAMLSAATNMSASDAATNLAKISQSFNLPIENAMRLGSVLNELENTTAATAEEIAEALKRVGAAGSNIGLSVEFVAALEATLISAGMKSSRAGTRIRNALNIMSSETEKVAKLAGVSFQEFNKILQEDSVEALKLLIKNLDKTKNEIGTSSDIMGVFGKVGGFAIQTLVNNYQELSDNINTANNEMRTGLSLVRETGTMTKTTAGQWELLKNSIASATIESGGFFNKLIQGARSYQLITEHTGKSFGEQLLGDMVGVGMTSPYVALMENSLGFKTGDFAKKLGLLGGKDLKNILDEQFITLQKLGKEAGFTAEDYNKMFNDINTLGKSSMVLAVSQSDAYIKTITDNLKVEKELSVTRQLAKDDLGGFEGAMNKLIVANEAFSKSQQGTLDEYTTANWLLEDLRDNIKDTYGSDILAIIDGYISKNKEVATSIDDISLSQKRAAFMYKLTTKNITDQLKELNKEYKLLKDVRFEGEKEALDNIHAIELAIKKETLAQLGLTDAVESTNEALSDSGNNYKAWVDTVHEFIKATVESGNMLGENVSNSVKQYQTLLMSTSRFENNSSTSTALDEEKTALEILEEERNRAQLEYDIGIGEQHYALKQYIDELENEDRIVAESVNTVKDSLKSKKEEIDALTETQQTIIDKWTDAQNAVTAYELGIDTATTNILTDLGEQLTMLDTLIAKYKELNLTKNYIPDMSTGVSVEGNGLLPYEQMANGILNPVEGPTSPMTYSTVEWNGDINITTGETDPNILSQLIGDIINENLAR